MNWEAIGAIGEVGGAIAVVATLVYLARQIRQSTETARVAAYHQASQQISSASTALSTDPALAEIFATAVAGGIDSLEPPDRLRFEAAISAYYFGFESLLAHHEKGLIDPDLWRNTLDNDMQLMGSPLGREYLASRRGPISRRLEAVIKEHLSGDGAA